MNIVKNKLIDSIIKTALVIVLIYGFAFAMTQWGHQRLLKPAVMADSDGVILLRAADVEIMGPGPARLEDYAGQNNIGWWNDPAQWLQVRFKPGKSGLYQAELFYALPGGQRSVFALETGASKYEFELSGKGGWNTWQSVDLGTIEFKSTAMVNMAIRSLDTFGARGIMNFCWIKLTPQ